MRRRLSGGRSLTLRIWGERGHAGGRGLRPLAGFLGAILLSLRAGGVSADPSDALRIQLQRGVAATGSKTSDQPALRMEGQSRLPSPGFKLGAALGAWRNAANSLDYDVKTPSGDGNDNAAISIDCDDERTSFSELEADRTALGLVDSGSVVRAAGLPAGIAAAWSARRLFHPTACR